MTRLARSCWTMPMTALAMTTTMNVRSLGEPAITTRTARAQKMALK